MQAVWCLTPYNSTDQLFTICNLTLPHLIFTKKIKYLISLKYYYLLKTILTWGTSLNVVSWWSLAVKNNTAVRNFLLRTSSLLLELIDWIVVRWWVRFIFSFSNRVPLQKSTISHDFPTSSPVSSPGGLSGFCRSDQ